MNIDELCAEVNRSLLEGGISISDGRTASTVTPRNVRYYRTIGMLSPPRRSEGRAEYDNSHVDEIVAIKVAQSEGISLEDLRLRRQTAERLSDEASIKDVVTPLMFSSRDIRQQFTLKSIALEPSQSFIVPATADTHELAEVKPVIGWSLRIGHITVSGAGRPLTTDQMEAIVEILGEQKQSD